MQIHKRVQYLEIWNGKSSGGGEGNAREELWKWSLGIVRLKN